MTGIIALCILVAASYTVVIAGGIAFELTGVDREMARFQALSCFTGTGYTTRASERIVEHRQRRRIATVLIVLGYANAASVIATLMQSVDVSSVQQSLMHLVAAVVCGAATWYLMRRHRERLMDWIRAQLTRRLLGQHVAVEVLFRAGPGLGVARVSVPEGCAIAGIPLADLHLPSRGLSVLLFEDESHVYHPPTGDSALDEGAHVLVWGHLDEIEAAFRPGSPDGAVTVA